MLIRTIVVNAVLFSARTLAQSGTQFGSPPPLREEAAREEGPARSEPDEVRPLRWLLQAQNENGGWGSDANGAPDVATTSLSGIALLRLGHTPSSGEHREATRKALTFVVRAVERAPGADQFIEPPGTLPQRKLGRGIDTFLAAQFLGEAMKSMPPGEDRRHVQAALQLCVAKIQAAQGKDGSFSHDGWAPVLSSAFAAGGLYAAKEVGVPVAAESLAESDEYLLRGYDAKSKQFRTEDSAGVALYQAAGVLGSASRTGKLSAPSSVAAREHLTDEAFVRRFGSYGGEEHVSYMLSTEAFAKAGAADWSKWSQSIRKRLADIQREDGTWRGDHCITSTAFCTAASLITLAIRPASVPRPM